MNSKAIIQTNFGDITIELDTEKTPVTCANFINYATKGHYDNTLFHRVINNFMIQGGGLNLDMSDKTTDAAIENEADKGGINDIGTIAMARTSAPHSATSQFFINVNNNSFLNFKAKNDQGWGYCVFGKVVDGMDVVNKIKLVKTGSKNYHQDVPVENVIITKVIV